MSTKSHERLYGSGIRIATERAAHARKEADRLACEAWSKRMFGYKGPAQPSPTLGDALDVGYCYLEVYCLGCETNQTIALDVVRRPKTTPIHEFERYMRCKVCSKLRGYPYKRRRWSTYARPRYRRVIRARSGGPASDELMCNLYSITNQAAIAALFRIIRRYGGNLPPMPGVFPDYPAPVVRDLAGEREMVLMRWSMPPPLRTGGPPVTNIRNTASPHWRAWLKPENRCLVPFNSFSEYAPEPDPVSA